MGMFDTDKVYGGKRLDEWCEEAGGLPQTVVLWDCGIVAENVDTSVGKADKAELVINQPSMATDVIKVGTFASAITEKVKHKAEGDLPAIVRFEQVTSQKWDSDALVMTFVAPYRDDVAVPGNLDSPECHIEAIDLESVPFD